MASFAPETQPPGPQTSGPHQVDPSQESGVQQDSWAENSGPSAARLAVSFMGCMLKLSRPVPTAMKNELDMKVRKIINHMFQ